MQINPVVIDVSHWQNINDWQELHDEDGILGVINKATEGPGMVDTTFAARRAPVGAAGMLYGAYHFARPGDPVQQARHFLSVVGSAAGLLLALDHEDPRVSLSWAKTWMQTVHDAVGRWPVLYSGFLIKQQLGNKPDALMSQTRLWLAQYSARPTWPAAWKAPWLWQFTSDGHDKDGDDPVMDMDSYAGTQDQLRAEWAA